MDAAAKGGWISTERTHPLYFAQVFGGTPLVAIALTYFWFAVLIPQVGFALALLTVLLVSVACAVIDVFTWTMFRPTAVRASPAGIEIQRRFAAVFRIPGEEVVLQSRSPEGYGFASDKKRNGFILSPNQFAGAKRYFPVEDGAKPIPRPLP